MTDMTPPHAFEDAPETIHPVDAPEPMSDPATRRPRIAIMGEFSAGKSTLSNLLLGARPLPEKVTATRLSPVWLSKGTDAPYRVDMDGTEEPILLDEIESVPLEETRVIRVFLDAEILNYCDLIDFPGISDPNMESEIWERILDEVDMVLWCTHATQAWRQSESAVWEMIPEAVRARSLLLITRFDKLVTERDRARVLHRVTTETEGLFEAIFPIALTHALENRDNYDGWVESGAAAFADHLVERLQAEPPSASTATQPDAGSEDSDLATADGVPTSDVPPVAAEPAASDVSQLSPIGPEPRAIVPRRVRSAGQTPRPRPTA